MTFVDDLEEWLSVDHLARIFGRDPSAIFDHLSALSFADDDRPSNIALRHGLAMAGSDGARWHRDIAQILLGAGLEPVTPTPRYEQETLFGDAPEPAQSKAAPKKSPPQNFGAPSASSKSGVKEGRGPIGKPKPGFDLVIATDGSCSGNPGPGGWAFVEQMSGDTASGGSAKTTNNIMELTAMVKALEYAGPEADLLLRVDSSYVINSMTKWARGWRAKGWRKADGKPVLNRDIIERMVDLYEARTGRTEVEWVRGHSGDAANELADELAVKQTQAHARS